MEQAISADKQNPLPVYQKANVLLSLERFDEALKELEQLTESAPHESSVYALMGKIYKRLEMYDKAMFCFGLALDLKPPAADIATIKVLIPIYFLISNHIRVIKNCVILILLQCPCVFLIPCKNMCSVGAFVRYF